MITTVCMNPCFDRTVTVDAMTVGGTNRIRSMRTDLGGKGVNVAVVAGRLGLEAQCIGCMGRENAPQLVALMDAEGLPHRFLPVDGRVRTNTKIVSLDGQPVTELNEPGAPMTAEALAAFVQMAAEAAAHSDYLVVTGSLPPGCPAGTYRDLICAAKVPCILDVGGTELLLGVEAQPFLIKPNRDELEATVGRKLETLADIRRAAEELMAHGAQNVLVSLGGDGALLATCEGAYYAPPVPVKVCSTVGAGDSMVGGLLAGLMQTGSLREALRSAVAAGTASVMTEGTQLIVRADYEALVEQVQIQEL